METNTYFIVYQLTNTINNKIYVGCHQTKNIDDGYMGSGRRLLYAKRKYGILAFKKQILGIYETYDQMLEAEAKIVNENFLNRKDVYNLTIGGRAGNNKDPRYRWARIKGAIAANKSIKKRTNIEYKKKLSVLAQQRHADETFGWPRDLWIGRKHKDESKPKMRAAHLGKHVGTLNSQYGKCWIYNTNEKRSISIKKEDISMFLSAGWKQGRKIKFI